ncbi:hypothetical protein [Allorhodopirellula solitaria]|uniref:Uncharacterized protein n=1 Tax=Allorhodopirellula solitaria TaxID=2527987 RepID=A0A5C5XXD5_9BACT|nr:hypothetical protein [Allorhodopirellula solitaria]TWT66555.1 hypothetical protein CA85_26520 [Allorhodopirellula solitaria]
MWQIQNSGNAEQPGKNIGQWSIEGDQRGSHAADAGEWTCCATGGRAGITLGDQAGALQLNIANVGDDALPTAGEQYVCGDAWKIHFPQATGQYSLRLSVRVVQASETRIVWEPTFSIQTSLLDSAPSLELTARGESDRRVAEVADALAAQVSICAVSAPDTGQVIVLLGPNDAPFTKDRCSRTRLDLRIFGDFLEKGVIRKTRPWIIMDRSEDGVSADELADYCSQLCQTPLPLTA